MIGAGNVVSKVLGLVFLVLFAGYLSFTTFLADDGLDAATTGPVECIGPGIVGGDLGDGNIVAPPPAPLARLTLGDPVLSGLEGWPGFFDSPPKAFDVNGDGRDEILAYSADGNVYVYDSVTGRALAKVPTSCPSGWYNERLINGVEAGILRPGEPVSLVLADPAAYIAVWQYNASASTPEQFVFQKIWEKRMTTCFNQPSMDAKAVLADLDRDRSIEILVQTEEIGFFALNTDGAVRWHQCWAGGNSAPTVADLEEDGSLEVIFASDTGFISVIDGPTGTIEWTFAAEDYGLTPASVSTSPTVAELDGLASHEILFTTRHAPSPDSDQWDEFHMGIFAIHRNLTTWQGELLWMRQPEWANPLSYAHLIVEDVDGDKSPDIFGMDWNTIGHKPGNWEVLGPAHVFRLDASGNDVWVQSFDTWWSNKDLILADFDGDGSKELLVNAPDASGDALLRLSAATGQSEVFLSLHPWKILRSPTLIDVDNDGSFELAVPVTPDRVGESWGAIFIFDLRS